MMDNLILLVILLAMAWVVLTVVLSSVAMLMFEHVLVVLVWQH